MVHLQNVHGGVELLAELAQTQALAAPLLQGAADEAGQGDAGDLHGVLEGEENALLGPLVGGLVGDVFPLEEDLTAGDVILGVAHERVAQGGLAGSVGPHEDVGLAGVYIQINAVENLFLLYIHG